MLRVVVYGCAFITCVPSACLSCSADQCAVLHCPLQVVHDAYARFTEESSLQSQWDSNTDKTEVDIKVHRTPTLTPRMSQECGLVSLLRYAIDTPVFLSGLLHDFQLFLLCGYCCTPCVTLLLSFQGLEVSKPGQYKPLSPDKTNMETSDSGVEFNTAALPLDSDTDGLPTYTSQKLLLDSELMNGTAVPEVKLSASQTPDSKMSGSLTPDPPTSGTPDADLMSHTVPEPAPRSGEPSPGSMPMSNAAPPPEATPGPDPEVSKDAVSPTPDQGSAGENSST